MDVAQPAGCREVGSMRRPLATVREAGPDDVEGVVRLWSEAGAGGVEHPPQVRDDACRALAHLAADPDERLLVADADGELVAAIHLRRAPLSPLHLEHVVHTSFLLVLPDHRRHGYARLMLEAAAAWAEEKDIHHVTAITASSSRDTNRFLARLGLGTMATVRVAPTATLRKRLSPAPLASTTSSRNIGQVLAARRSMRRRQAGQV
jgi:GNAT superfamily N-acetyltransferase